ncbi:MAG TPA: type II toxin-antitoxin system VapC family toxin [Terracidiphilus sp.]|nr:type II toxin-antitoxin system VapC family toxin [Terracidiphilus sp.]
MILLDTHVIVWFLGSPERLSARARHALLQAANSGEGVGYSSVSIFEIAYAVHRKRLTLTVAVEDFIRAIEKKLTEVPLSTAIAISAADFPEPFHGDPMDRIIAATAIVENCTLITHDDRIRRAGVCKTLW